jgi:hypothetical protein
MAISVVLRLVEQALRAGRLAGEAEIVQTGERVVVRDADELVRFLRPAVESGNGPEAGSATPRRAPAERTPAPARSKSREARGG